MKNNKPLIQTIKLENCWLALILFTFAINLAQADGSIDHIKESCLSCHAANSTTANLKLQGPQLGGFSKNYIAKQLHSFKSGLRGTESLEANAMSKAVANLTDDNIKVLAKWASSQNKQKLFDYQTNASLGAQLYAEHCRGCHNSFMGRAMTGSPKLGYLNADYISKQLQLFKQDQRIFNNPTKHQTKMSAVVKTLSTEQLSLITSFVRGMPTLEQKAIRK